MTVGANQPAGEPARPAGPNWALLAFVLSVAALIVSLSTWFQHREAIGGLARRQAALAAEVGSSRTVIDVTGAPMLGSTDAAITLVEFSDYECPFCIRHFEQTMPRITENYIRTGRIRYAFRDWPVDELHPQAIRAHEAAHCAGEQRKFWEMHPRLFSRPGTHGSDQILEHAQALGLDLEAFRECVSTGRSTDAIRATSRTAVDLGANGTPAFFVGVIDPATQRVTVINALAGAQPYETFARVLDDALARVR